MQNTQGGMWGHSVRRLIHVLMFFIPPLYFGFGAKISAMLHLHPEQILICIIIIILVFEILRIKRGWLLFGQRQHERHFLSSFAQGAVAIAITLLAIPGGYAHGLQYAWPMVAVLAVVDPVMGEMRRFKLQRKWVLSIGLIVAVIIWALFCWNYEFNPWLVLIMPLVAIAAEVPNLRWLDDNATLLLFPLLVLWLFVR